MKRTETAEALDHKTMADLDRLQFFVYTFKFDVGDWIPKRQGRRNQPRVTQGKARLTTLTVNKLKGTKGTLHLHRLK
jgi:hypothetical protein